MNDLMEAMRRAGLRLDPSLTLALKALFQAEQIVSELDPSLPLINVAFGQLKGLMRDQLSMEYVAGTARKQAIRAAKEVVRRLPSLANATSKWLDQYESGKLGVYLDTSDLNNQVDRIDRTITQSVTLLALTMLLVGLLIGSAIVTNLDNEVVGIRLSDIAFFLFLGGAVVATAIGLRIVWAVWNSLSARK
jgi:ubiquinone biosynthesis protein